MPLAGNERQTHSFSANMKYCHMKANELMKSQLANCHAIKTHTIYEQTGVILLIPIKVYKAKSLCAYKTK